MCHLVLQSILVWLQTKFKLKLIWGGCEFLGFWFPIQFLKQNIFDKNRAKMIFETFLH